MGVTMSLNPKLKGRAAKSAMAAMRKSGEVVIHFSEFGNISHIMTHRNHKIYKSGPFQAWHLEHSRFMWQVYVCAIGVDQLGQPFVKEEAVPCKDLYTYEQLCDYLNEVAHGVVSSLHKDQVRGVGYIAAPYRIEFGAKKIFRMFESYGVFKHIAKS